MKPPFARFAYIAALLVVSVYAFVTLRGPRGVPAVIQKQTLIQEMEKRNQKLHEEIERKKEHIRRITDNPAEQELEIQNRLKLVHPNDKVYIIGQPAK
jgi:cell division protein FtsB